MIPLNKENIAKVKNQSGYYKIYNSSGTLVYVGWSNILRHRLQSYYQKDDFSVNRTKRKLRPEAKYFDYVYKPLMEARKTEKRLKDRHNPKHNHK